MRAVIFHGKDDVTVEDVREPSIQDATDAIVRVTLSAICGSDLWFYRGETDWPPGRRLGHEFVGVVEEVGAAVSRIAPGQLVAAPFSFSCGRCDECVRGIQTSCVGGGGFFGGLNDGAQAEAVRVPFADNTLVELGSSFSGSERLLKGALLATDVLGTGYHAAACAGVGSGDRVVVVGDGAVGLSAVLASRIREASEIIAVGHHQDRLALADQFGATLTVLSSDNEEAVDVVHRMTQGPPIRVLECVGTASAMELATRVIRPGGTIGYVGVPHGSENLDFYSLFRHNITLRGGVAPVRSYIETLLNVVESGVVDPSPIIDLEIPLEEAPDGYRAMNTRQALKVLVRP